MSTEYSDYRKAGAILIAYHQTRTDETGACTDYRVKSVRLSQYLPRGRRHDLRSGFTGLLAPLLRQSHSDCLAGPSGR
jgi:hypothetical protein